MLSLSGRVLKLQESSFSPGWGDCFMSHNCTFADAVFLGQSKERSSGGGGISPEVFVVI